MKKFNDLPIRLKILSIVAVNIFFYLLILTVVYGAIKNQQHGKEEIVKNINCLNQILIADKDFDGLRSDIQKALLIKQDKADFIEGIKQDIALHDSSLRESFVKINEIVTDPKIKESLAGIATPIEDYIGLVNKISDLVLSGDSTKRMEGLQNMQHFQPTFIVLKTKVDELRKLLDENTALAEEEATSGQKTAEVSTLLFILIALLVSIIAGLFVSKRIRKPIVYTQKMLKSIAAGELPEKGMYLSNDEIGEMTKGLNSLIDNLNNVKEFANEVGGGKFDTQIVVFNNEGIIGKSLAGMRESLKNVSLKDAEMNWTNTGLSNINEINRNNQFDEQKLYDSLISFLVRYVNANQGGIYILNKENPSRPMINMVCCYAYNKKKFITKSFPFGMGLVGQSIQEQDTLYFIDIPKDYIKIVSGLGSANPNCLLIVPIKINDETIGAIELALFNTLEKFQIEFVEKAAELIASVLITVKTATETKNLLDLSQQQAESMLSQDEEMRQNMEEMQASQEEMMRREEELRTRIKELEEEIESAKK